jgi:hypothetical protein
VIVGTPGRVVDHLSNTKGFSLKALKHLVLDEADKLLDMDFEAEIDQILKVSWWWCSHQQSLGGLVWRSSGVVRARLAAETSPPPLLLYLLPPVYQRTGNPA